MCQHEDRPFAFSDIPPHLDDGAWYHGSPHVLDILAAGSTITRSRAIAETFAHKPACLGINEEGHRLTGVCHNGTADGYLYVVDESIGKSAIRHHPDSAYHAGGLEWLTNRPVRLRKVADLPLTDPPCQPDCPRRPQS
jgi:hypothetical protein